ncbi:MAG TPA: hypothetical protein VN857_15570 [Chthoniobacterales bacterium]|jgi:hypothetical protein|nr:hypothetical protein [Chthoniobacterales bacterium]
MKRLTAATLAVFTFCGLFAASASGAFIVHLIDKEIIYLEPPVKYPAAEKTKDPSVVISPYYPHNRVVVRGIQSGYLVMDPSVGKAFIRP